MPVSPSQRSTILLFWQVMDDSTHVCTLECRSTRYTLVHIHVQYVPGPINTGTWAHGPANLIRSSCRSSIVSQLFLPALRAAARCRDQHATTLWVIGSAAHPCSPASWGTEVMALSTVKTLLSQRLGKVKPLLTRLSVDYRQPTAASTVMNRLRSLSSIGCVNRLESTARTVVVVIVVDFRRGEFTLDR